MSNKQCLFGNDGHQTQPLSFSHHHLFFPPPPTMLVTSTTLHDCSRCANNAHIDHHVTPWTSTTMPGHPRRATSPPQQPPPSQLQHPTSREPFWPHLTCRSSTTMPEHPHPRHHHGPVNYDTHHQRNRLGPTSHAEARQPHQNVHVTTTAQSITTPTINGTV